MLGISVFAVFWLQSTEAFVSLRYWLPLATLGITVLAWTVTASPEMLDWRQNWPALAVLMAVIVLVDLGRYVHVEFASLPTALSLPLILAVLLALAAVVCILATWQAAARLLRIGTICAIVTLFIVIKSPELNAWMTGRIASLRGQALPSGAAPVAWLGFSYLAFRLLHTVRDRQSGRLPAVSLAEYADYAVFFPAFTSGPIDRIERFVEDLRKPAPLCNEDWIYAGRRLILGLFKKFVIADLLAVISINDVLVSQVHAGAWLWVFLYAYAFRIYFDFSGYTDLAIGMARLMGVHLPENFAAPYLKPNLTQFWNSWHISLTQWFRAYVFNPLTRAMRTLSKPLPVWLIVLVAQLATMILIGLWHGITWGFAAWGLWHAVGLFIHNRWTEIAPGRMPAWTRTGRGQKAMSAVGTFLTFNYVALGWLFFTLTRPGIAWLALRKLFGFA
jgi:D-alanyl-lipoteichoic acid acyltransferase DltB (MBOAT superfamily)